LRSLIHATDPYLNVQGGPSIDHGWGGKDPIFRKLIEQVRPRRILELGTWYGQSAITMAKACREQPFQMAEHIEILCVDTFLGSVEHWQVKEYRPYLMLQNGRPEFYRQFLHNVVN